MSMASDRAATASASRASAMPGGYRDAFNACSTTSANRPGWSIQAAWPASGMTTVRTAPPAAASVVPPGVHAVVVPDADRHRVGMPLQDAHAVVVLGHGRPHRVAHRGVVEHPPAGHLPPAVDVVQVDTGEPDAPRPRRLPGRPRPAADPHPGQLLGDFRAGLDGRRKPLTGAQRPRVDQHDPGEEMGMARQRSPGDDASHGVGDDGQRAGTELGEKGQEVVDQCVEGDPVDRHGRSAATPAGRSTRRGGGPPAVRTRRAGSRGRDPARRGRTAPASPSPAGGRRGGGLPRRRTGTTRPRSRSPPARATARPKKARSLRPCTRSVAR